ncbi:MAG: hypothetical protein A2V69_01490 [Candidatus Portnoybacteria bacterium RBG_13_40_8]|uniref:Acylneuraminate cytidylyltransferase n=1 Tax=Candidatus Portnoybacteria bacterium RBG_13_40_8 TaxID=1801990 RepID=A0A1G2F582_9BACT|nr:MAG: hypothetical protein A2V69_01490 [Candidatus Portnoybacteria bacterium RBG_13_40_8]
MYKNKKILVIIPARGGSKGIKNKNITNVCNKPLVAYTIGPALRIKKDRLVDEVIVSTDSRKIADIAQRLGAHVPFLRPKKISGDKAKPIDFVVHAINHFEKKGIFYDCVVILQPTSPLRKYKDIKEAIKLYLKNKNESLISAYCEDEIDETELYHKEKNFGIPLSFNHNKGIRRQELKNIFVRDGTIYISSVKHIKKCHRIISNTPLLFEISKNRALDIDTQKDLKTLRKTLCE